MLSLQSSLHTISSLVHTAKMEVRLWAKWSPTRGEKQWTIIKPSPRTVAGSLTRGQVIYKRLQQQGFDWENFSALDRWSLIRGRC